MVFLELATSLSLAFHSRSRSRLEDFGPDRLATWFVDEDVGISNGTTFMVSAWLQHLGTWPTSVSTSPDL